MRFASVAGESAIEKLERGRKLMVKFNIGGKGELWPTKIRR